MKIPVALLSLMLGSVSASAQYYTVSTLYTFPGTNTGPTGVAVDSNGNIYAAGQFTVSPNAPGIGQIFPPGSSGENGTAQVIAGGQVLGHVDGTGSAAQFGYGASDIIATDSSGNIYVADGGYLRKVVPSTGVVTSLSGINGNTNSVIAGTGIVVNPSGNIFDDAGTHVSEFVPGGNPLAMDVITAADIIYDQDGSQPVSSFACTGLAEDASGAFYVAAVAPGPPSTIPVGSTEETTYGPTQLYVLKLSGSTVTQLFSMPIASDANVDIPATLAVDGSGNVFLGWLGNLYVFNSEGGPTLVASFDDIQALAVDSSGRVYVAVYPSSLPGFIALVTPSKVPPISFVHQPISQTVENGSTVVFSTPAVALQPTGTMYYRWYLDGTLIETTQFPTFVIQSATPANEGSYTCVADSGFVQVASNVATLNVVTSSEPGRLTNLSCRAYTENSSNQLIAGFVTGGSGTSGSEPVLIRASGPALSQFNVTGVIPDPELTLNSSSGIVATNSGWAGSSLVASTAAAVGAFAWASPTSMDSALVATLPIGAYTAQVTGASGDSGVALAEVYDATPGGSLTTTSPRLINISARVEVGTGGNILIAGFVIGGTTSETVLIRASGPALEGFGIKGTLPDPQLSLFQSNGNGTSTLLDSNTGWGGDPNPGVIGDPAIASAAMSVGAFPWGNSATADSAILITLPPGAYTAEVSGASGDTGVALVEVYEVP